MSGISLARAATPILISIDAGSSSVRALLYDARGRAIDGSEHQLEHELATTPDGGSMADPDHLLDLITACLDSVNSFIDNGGRVAGAVGFSSFWHSLLGIDAGGNPVTPVLMWADKRSGPWARQLKRELDEGEIHARTGCVLHSSYWPAKLAWLRETAPGQFANARHWISFADYVYLRMHGELLTTYSMASATGLLDIHDRGWDARLLDHVGIDTGQLPPLVDRTHRIRSLRRAYGTRWPRLRDLDWLPAIGDGAAANVGAGCTGPERAALTIGTSGAMRVMRRDRAITVPPNAWCYLLDEQRQLYGGALSNGGNIVAWLGALLAVDDLDDLTAKAAALTPDGHGLTMLPFLAGERSPSWNDDLSGLVHGLTLDTDGTDIFRATLEAIAYRFGALYEALSGIMTAEHSIRANGGAILRSPLWLQIVADTLNHSVVALDPAVEASAQGAAICALDAIGAIDGLNQPIEIATTYHPKADAHTTYAAARRRQHRLEVMIDSFLDSNDREEK